MYAVPINSSTQAASMMMLCRCRLVSARSSLVVRRLPEQVRQETITLKARHLQQCIPVRSFSASQKTPPSAERKNSKYNEHRTGPNTPTAATTTTTTTTSTDSTTAPSSSSATSTTVLTLTVIAGMVVGLYTWQQYLADDATSELQLRHELYSSSRIPRHQVAAYLVSPENRNAVTDHINRIVNVPGLGERVEGILIRKAVDECMTILEHILVRGTTGPGGGGGGVVVVDHHDESSSPSLSLMASQAMENSKDDTTISNEKIAFFLSDSSLLNDSATSSSTITNSSSAMVIAMENYLVEQINTKINIYGLSEAQEAILIRGVVHRLFELYPGIIKLL